MDFNKYSSFNSSNSTSSEKVYFVNETGASFNLTAAEACAKSESVSFISLILFINNFILLGS